MPHVSWLFALVLVAGESQAVEPPLFADGFEDCSMMDLDFDRLAGCREVFGDVSDPFDVDTDDDGLPDGDEVLGTEAGLRLDLLGVRPKRRDLLVEIDWLDDALECGAHTHRPDATTIEEVRAFYAAAPLENPDGSTGINAIVDVGQGGLLVGGNRIVGANPIVDDFAAGYSAIRDGNFLAERRAYFHYQLHAHRIGHSANKTSGLGDIGGDDSIVTLYCQGSANNVRNTIIHELGHNLGLMHGGNTSCNYKPNYNSVMNYRYQFGGVDLTCDAQPDAVHAYSTGSRIALDENALDEFEGVCGSHLDNWQPIDWNGNGKPNEVGIAANLNPDPKNEAATCGGVLTVLTDFDDWSAVDLAAGTGTPAAGAPPVPVAHCPGPEG